MKYSEARREIWAGCTTFLTMVYIVFVNPAILHQVGMDLGSVFVATCVVTAVGSFLIGALANVPIAIAPGMALNVYFVYVLVDRLHLSWQEATCVVLMTGILLIVITLTGVYRLLIDSIPSTLNTAITIGLGAFLVLLAFRNLGWDVLHDKWSGVSFFKGQILWLFLLGMSIIFVGYWYRFQGFILISIVTITGAFWYLKAPHNAWKFYVSLPVVPRISLTCSHLFSLKDIIAVISMTLITFFDSAATLLGLLYKIPGKRDSQLAATAFKPALLANGIATALGGFLGTASTSTYLESAAGIAAGGRGRLTAWTVSGLFVLTLFLSPLITIVPPVATAPVLFFIGVLMLTSSRELPRQYTQLLPALVTVIVIVATWSIADGLAAGLLLHVIIRIFRTKQITKSNGILSFILCIYFALRFYVVT